MDLEMQLRQAECRRAELERQHQEALQALRGCGPDMLEARQSRVRELEKKVALETVRCEELQLELAASQRNRTQQATSASGASVGVGSWPGKGTEIERIMAKIEQDNRILAELEHSRSTTLGPGLATSASSHALGECSPPISPITMSHTTPSIYPTASSMGVSGGGTGGGNYQNHPGHNITGYMTATGYSGAATQQYNALGGHSAAYSATTANKLPMVGGIGGGGGTLVGGQPHSALVQLGTTGISNLGQPSILGTSLSHHQTIPPSMVTSTSLGASVLPSSIGYTTSVISNTTTFTNPLVANPTYNTNVPSSTFGNPVGVGMVGGALAQYGLTSTFNPVVTTSSYGNSVTFSNPLSSQFNSLPLSSGMAIKLKPLDDVDLATRRVPTPVTPHPPGWIGSVAGGGGGLSDRSRILTDGLDSDWSGIHTSDRSYLNGHPGDGQVDMLDIPGKGRCSVYIARFSYDPEPDSEEELSIQAGDYLLVWGEPNGPGGYLDAELLDGRRGLVPSHFAQRLIGDDLLEFHQAVLSTLREEEINAETFAADVQRLTEMADFTEGQEDESGDVPAPRQLTLERQLNKSVLISWTTPDNIGPGNQIESYHVYVDGVLKATIKATERTRALVEGVDSNRPHRISVRSVTANRRTSRDAACTMIIGRDTHQLGPSAVRATNITSTSAIISWLPANSNHQHVVCVNNVEVRTVKPGVYRHTITGLAPNTQYRVTVRAKHHRPASNVANLAEELPMPAAAHTDFRTLPKGLPDPPSEIQVEPGPQDGTLLVTWRPLSAPHLPGSSITGYAVYADGKKVTDVDSPTGDHALIDISKLLGLNPKHVTVRTKARDSQSADSVPTPIPFSVLRGGAARQRQQPHSAVLPAHMRQGRGQQQVQQQQQQIIEHDENLSDKEIFPSGSGHRQTGNIPAIAQRSIAEITKDSFSGNLSEDELMDRRNRQFQRQHRPGQQQQQVQQQVQQQSQQYYQQQGMQGQQPQQGQRGQIMNSGMRNQQSSQQPQQQQQQQGPRGAVGPAQQNANAPPAAQKRARWFVAVFDYDPATMSPNPDACEEELPFSEGDSIKVWGDKDADGFYWGECRGRRGYVPHNMVMEVEGPGQYNRDRWGDIYANMPVKRMVALYDYDPQELSPNVDAEVELSFQTGQIINVYGDMDDDGFYMGEIDGQRGLVPSNFLTEAPDQYTTQGGGAQASSSTGRGGAAGSSRGGVGVGSGRGHGPGARGPPPPPRDAGMRQRKTDACPVLPSQLDNATNTATPNTQVFTEHQGRGRGSMRGGRGGNSLQDHQPQQQQSSGMFGNTSGIFGNITGAFGGGGGNSAVQQQQQQQQQSQQQQMMNQYSNNQYGAQQQNYGLNRIQKGIPQVVPNNMGMTGVQQQQGQQMQGQLQGQQGQQGNLMQKLNEITAPGGDILSKGKELIFMKFGLGGK